MTCSKCGADAINTTEPPKNTQFMAHVGREWPWLVPCHYNEKEGNFVIATFNTGADGTSYYENETIEQNEIKGWIHVPEY